VHLTFTVATATCSSASGTRSAGRGDAICSDRGMSTNSPDKPQSAPERLKARAEAPAHRCRELSTPQLVVPPQNSLPLPLSQVFIHSVYDRSISGVSGRAEAAEPGARHNLDLPPPPHNDRRRAPGLSLLQAAPPDGWQGLCRQLLLKLEGRPALLLPLPCASLCLAPLASGGGSGKREGGVQFEPLLLTDAGGSWALPPLVLGAGSTGQQEQGDQQGDTDFHIIYAAAQQEAAAGAAAASAAPPRVLGVGRLCLAGPPPCPPSPALEPIKSEALRCCRLVCLASGEEAGCITLAVRLLRALPPPPSAQPPPQMLGAPQPSSSMEQQTARRRLRSAGVQTSPAKLVPVSRSHRAGRTPACSSQSVLCHAPPAAGSTCWGVPCAVPAAPAPPPPPVCY
jgi:hypothetical protein